VVLILIKSLKWKRINFSRFLSKGEDAKCGIFEQDEGEKE
jgi:hypothetical protein